MRKLIKFNTNENKTNKIVGAIVKQTVEGLENEISIYRIIMYVFIFLIKVTEWPPIGKIAAHSAYDMFHGISA